MDGKNITIFRYSKPLVQTSTVQKKLDYRRFFRKKLNSKTDVNFGEKGGTAVLKKNRSLMAVDRRMAPQEPQELIPIEEPKNINVHITTEKEELHLLQNLKKKSNRLVMSFTSVFPLEFFPTKINIQETKVSVIFRDLLSTQVHSMDINDISNVFIESAYFFANLKIITRTFIENDVKINKLKINDAIYARRLIEGLRIFCSEHIDTSKYEIPDLIHKLEDLSEFQREL